MSDTRIRDFTAPRAPSATVEVELHSANDLLLALLFLDGCDEFQSPDFTSYGIGTEWFADITNAISSETRGKIERVGSGDVWVSALSLLPLLPSGSTIDDFIDFLAGYDPVELRSRLISMKGMVPEEDLDTAAAAAGGDNAALEELLALPVFEEHKRWRDTVRLLLELEPEATRDLFVDTIASFNQEAFAPHASEFRPILERDFAAKQAMAEKLSPERLVELATNGISIEGRNYQRPIVLVPTVVGRPWVVFSDSPTHVIMSYPVADEYMDADPDAPPEWLIKIYKALGDERRMRILRRLAKGPASLHDLTKEFDASKSTIHHHLVLLRTAGLVKVTMGAEKEYSLRKDIVPETAAVLQAYMTGQESEETI